MVSNHHLGSRAYTIILGIRYQAQSEPKLSTLANQLLLLLLLDDLDGCGAELQATIKEIVPALPGFLFAFHDTLKIECPFSALAEDMLAILHGRSVAAEEIQLTVLALFYASLKIGDR